jgi:hypothetical protein
MSRDTRDFPEAPEVDRAGWLGNILKMNAFATLNRYLMFRVRQRRLRQVWQVWTATTANNGARQNLIPTRLGTGFVPIPSAWESTMRFQFVLQTSTEFGHCLAEVHNSARAEDD